MSDKPETPFVTRTLDSLEELLKLREMLTFPDAILSEIQRQEKHVLQGTRCPRCGKLVYPFYPVAVFCDACKLEFRERDRAATDAKWFAECLASRREGKHDG
jgi:hypothetical protein